MKEDELAEIVPLNLKEANRFVTNFHRHNKKVRGAKFSIGLKIKNVNELIGVAIAGRPLARLLDNGKTIEILRVCVKNGFKNANSILYGRMRKICYMMGYEKIITYTLQTENGASLKAIGAKPTLIKPHTWKRPQRDRPFQKIYALPKIRWEIPLKGESKTETTPK